MVLKTTGKKEELSVSNGTEIEVFSVEKYGIGYKRYCAILEDAEAKKTRLSVRYLYPVLKHNYSPPLPNTTMRRSIRPVPPPDPFPDVDFEEGDMIEAVHDGCWWSASVVKVLGNLRYLVYLRYEPSAIEIERKFLRPHMVWRNNEWFRYEKDELIGPHFSAGKCVEFRTEEDNYGDVWGQAKVIKENEDGTVLVKDYITLTEISLPYSKIRPWQPISLYRPYKLMEKVDALFLGRWYPGVVTKVPVPHGRVNSYDYVVVLGPNKESEKFLDCWLRPSLEWKDGLWVSDSEESPLEGHITPSTRIRGTVPTDLGDHKIALATGKEVRATHISDGGAMENPLPFSSNGVDVAETGNVSGTVRETLVPYTATHLTVELGSRLANTANVIKENTSATREPEIAAIKEFHSPVVLGIAATVTKSVVKTQQKTSPRKKLQAMKEQKGSADSDGEKAPEETKIREIVNKRKRGQPHKFISTEPKQKTGVAANGSNAAIMLNSVVEKHVDVVETPPAKGSKMHLPFVKKSPVWKVLESMEVFKAVPQSPHFNPLLESEEELREGVAIGKMVMYTSLLESVNNLQVDHPISSINRIDECLLKLEKHGFNVTKPRSRIAKILFIKERQTWALEELKAVEENISESDNKRIKYEEEIVELQRAKVRLDMEIAQMQSRAAVLDQKVQNVDQDFREIVTTPW